MLNERGTARPRAVSVFAAVSAIAALVVLAAYLGGYERLVDGIEVEQGIPRRRTEPIGLAFTVPVVAVLGVLAAGLWLMRRWALLATVALLAVGLLVVLGSLFLEADETADVVALLIVGVPLTFALVTLVRAMSAGGLLRGAVRR